MRPTLFCLAVLFAGHAAAQAPAQSTTLEERMSQSDFRAAGLDKLNAEELQFLNGWLAEHAGGSATNGAAFIRRDGKAVFYPDDSAREEIEAHIAGTFTGWRGTTIFRLDNGQEWVQAESGSFGPVRLENPSVKIMPMSFGSWLMRVDGCGCSVRVKRTR